MPLTPTHRGGGTLDLVITKSEQTLTEMKVDPPDVISDLSLISWCCPLDLQLCSAVHGVSTAEDYFELYQNVLTRLADRFAPIKRVTLHRQRLAVWMDDECRQLRRKSRLLQRRYRRSVMGRARKTAAPGVSEKGASLLVNAGKCPGKAVATTLGCR